MENRKRKRKWKKSTVIIFMSFLLAFGSMGVFAQTWFDLYIAEIKTNYTPGGFVLKSTTGNCAYVYINNVTISSGRTNLLVKNVSTGTWATSLLTMNNTHRGLLNPIYLPEHQGAVGDMMHLYMGSASDLEDYTVSGSWDPSLGY